MLKIFFLILILFFTKVDISFAQEKLVPNQSSNFITIVNPVRVSSYNPNILASFKAEYQEIKKRQLPATWLLTFDILENQGLVDEIKKLDSSQEIGLFMEITPNFAKAAGVTYHQSDSWHRAQALFLIGYTQSQRQSLIDTLFKKFKDSFGQYPTSVGAWWIDSFSLEYMQQKYGVTVNLGVADQFSTDSYSIWGQYFSLPFYPSKNHAGIPASKTDKKIDVVTLQWAPRDPLNSLGAGSTSKYSVQDYHTLGLSDQYLATLIRLYAKSSPLSVNEFGQLTIGLEADLSPDTYSNVYSRMLDTSQRVSLEGNIQFLTMSQFSLWYREHFPDLSPVSLTRSDDLLGTHKRVIWYQSPNYRVGLVWDRAKLKVVDFRTYHSNFQEPFFSQPLEGLDLFINNPSIIDTVSNPDISWEINSNQMFDIPIGENLEIKLDSKKLTLTPTQIRLENIDLPQYLYQQPALKIDQSKQEMVIMILDNWPVSEKGITFRNLAPQLLYFTNSDNWQKPANIKKLAILITVLSLVIAVLLFKKIYKFHFFKIGLLIGSLVIVLTPILTSRVYYVSQAEVDALQHLKVLPKGKVAVFKKDCIKCLWHSENMPAVLVNQKRYVGALADKKISSISFEDSLLTKEDWQKLLKYQSIKYIYSVRYEKYQETLPERVYELNLKKVYENANAVIWQVD